jgi:hypothetical protein
VAFREHDDVGHGVRGAFFDGNNWTSEQVLGGQTYSSPTVVYNRSGNRLWVAHVGVDNRPYLAYQPLGTSNWYGWTSVPTGGGLYGPLGFAVAGSGRMQLAARAVGTNTVAFTELDSNGNSLFGRWTADVNEWQTRWAINLTVIAGVVYALMTGMNHNAYYKPSYNGNPN